MKEKNITRRTLLNRSASVAAGLAAAKLMPPQTARAAEAVAGANERITIGIMGTGGRGQWLVKEVLNKRKDIDIACLTDPDEGRRNETADIIEKTMGKRPKVVNDFRKMLEDKSIDAIFNITPDHWHALGTILSCQAGKDVYVEKPASHTPWEGRQMVNAARKYKRVVQVGTQTRSGDYAQHAVEYIRSGKLGDVHFARVVNMKLWDNIGHKPDEPAPPTIDYDLWLGPAPKRPFNWNRCHYAWHWWWDYSGGDIINDGIHQIDLARWLIGRDYPKTTYATGLKVYDHDGETPDTQAVTWQFDNNLTMVFELTLWTPYMKKLPWELRDGVKYPSWPQDGMRVEIYGTKGLMYCERHGGGWQVYNEDEKVVAQELGHHPHVRHIDNFFECVKTRGTPNGDIEELHRSTLLSQFGNISYRLGGRQLKLDKATEQFVDDKEANSYLKRTYRKGFEVPEQV